MTEEEWLSSSDPLRMLTWVEDEYGVMARKMHLFVAACAGYEPDDLLNVRQVFAGKGAHKGYLGIRLAGPGSNGDMDNHYCPNARAAAVLREVLGWPEKPVVAGEIVSPCGCEDYNGKPFSLCEDCHGQGYYQKNPAWLTAQVVRLAEAVYQEESGTKLDRARLMILSDALEEAGCEDQTILRHLRHQVWQPPRQMKAGWLCPQCGGAARWRSGVGFEHEKRCGACNISWEPGSAYSLPGRWLDLRDHEHVVGCHVVDALLGRR